MTSQELGSSFEIITEEFFLSLFEQIQIQVNNHWIQKAGYQFGFDVGFEIAVMNDAFFKRGIFIECKNYKNTILQKAQLHEKLIQFDMSSYDKKDSIFIFLSPKVDLKEITQDSNPKLLEDYFNNNKPFKTIILTPNNNIKKIFSLSEKVFLEVYEDEIFQQLHDTDKNKILDYFKILFFSKGELPNFNESQQRRDYLEEASINFSSHYVPRKLKTNKFSFFEEDKSLIDVVKDNKFILLLGEPGSGKTTELISVSKYFESRISELEITPIFVSLSNVKKFNEIEDILPHNWHSNKKIVIILDAFDEFQFKNKLKDAILNLLDYKDISVKVIVSCRTYAYNNELDSLNIVKYYLDGFNNDQSFELLNRNFNISREDYSKIANASFEDVLEDPFMLNQIGVFHSSNGYLPNNVVEVYDSIKSSLSEEDIYIYKTLALMLELTKTTGMQKTELRNLFGVKYKLLSKLNLIQNSFDKESFKFKHKNYQEYFAALSLSELNFEIILNFILIEDTKKIHPSLFNTITFLINLLELEKYNRLVEWLIENESELLFKADKNRIESFRVKVFQKYFIRECIEKTFWINNDRTFSVKEIAEFGDCDENLEYLRSIINDQDNHFRVIISALDLFSFFTIPQSKKEEIKKDFFELLESPLLSDRSELVKSHIIDCIYDQKLHKGDDIFLKKIFELFKKETSKQINRALLSLIEDYEPIDEFFWYVQEELLRDRRIVEREVKDDVLRGNSWVLERLIMRFAKSSHFIALVKYYFDEDTNNYSDQRFTEKILEKCLFFEGSAENFLVQLLSSFENKTKYYFRENLLRSLILQSKPESQISAFEYLFENFTFDNIGYFLATVSTKNTISIVIRKFTDGSINIVELDFYRNVIANHGNRELAGEFNNIMISNGFVFNHPFLLENEFAELKAQNDNKPQENFDLLFDKEKLLSEIEKIFIENKSRINSDKISAIDRKWYEKHGHSNTIDIAYTVLSRIIFEIKDSVEYNDVKKILNNPLVIISKIKSQIESQKNGNNFIIREEQKVFIRDWCIEEANKIDFHKIMKSINQHQFNILKDYQKLKHVLFFIDKFNFELPQEFLLNSIEFFDIEKSDDEDKNFEKLSKKVGDEELFSERIIYNLLHKDLIHLTLHKHVQYALDNYLVKTFEKIKELFIKDNLIYNMDTAMEQLFQLTQDVAFLKKCCVDVKSHNCWTALNILMGANIEHDFCIAKAIEFLESEIDNEKNYYYSNALGILFQLNSLSALKYLSLFLEVKSIPSLREVSFANFSAIEDFNILSTLFEIIYMSDNNNLGHSGVSSFLKVYISNLSMSTDGYKKTLVKLNEIKDKLKKANSDTGIFHINQLIDQSERSYINAKSKPLLFDDALIKVEEILN